MKPQREPVLRTRRLILRPLRWADLDAYAAGINDPGVARMLARVPHPYGRGEAEAYFDLAAADVAAGAGFRLAVACDDRVVGNLSLRAMPWANEFGFWVARPYWGMGIATEAARAFFAYAFDALAVRIVRAGVFADNPASLKVQRKLGFRIVGRSIQRSLARNAEVDHIDTVLTPARFREALR